MSRWQNLIPESTRRNHWIRLVQTALDVSFQECVRFERVNDSEMSELMNIQQDMHSALNISWCESERRARLWFWSRPPPEGNDTTSTIPTSNQLEEVLLGPIKPRTGSVVEDEQQGHLRPAQVLIFV